MKWHSIHLILDEGSYITRPDLDQQLTSLYEYNKTSHSRMKKPKGLLIPLQRYAFRYPELTPAEDRIEGIRMRYPDIDWIDSNISHLRKEDGSTDIIELSDFYVEFVRKHHIEIIFGSTADFNALIVAYIAHHCPWLKTNSVESVLMCNSKYLSRKFLVPDEYNLKYYLIALDAPEDVAEAIKVVGFPMILKPTCGTGSMLIRKCENEQEILEYLDAFTEQEELGNISSYYKMNGKLLLGLEEKYPHLKTLNVLAEEFVVEEAAPSATAEFYIQNGEVTEVGIFDNIYWPSNPRCFVGCSTPTLCHPPEALKSARELMHKVAKSLVLYGFDNCIGNLEHFIFADGSTKVMEVNCRMFSQVGEINLQLMDNGDKGRMLVDLQNGVRIAPLTYKYINDYSAPKAGINLYINTMEEGLASDIFNYSYAEQLQRDPTIVPGLTMCTVVTPRDKQIVCTSDCGSTLAWCYVVGETYRDCMMKFKPIFHKLLLNSSRESLWEDAILDRKMAF